MEDKELEDSMNYWFEHYQVNGWRHCGEISFEKVIEIYWEQALDKTLQDLPEMTDSEQEKVIERIEKMF